MRTKNFLFLCLALSLMILSCNKVEDVLIIETTQQELETTVVGKNESFKAISVNSIDLPCVANHEFVITVEMDDGDIKLEYLRNSASASYNTPLSIGWTISDGNNVFSPSNSSTDFTFINDANYTVDVLINYDNNTTENINFCLSPTSTTSSFQMCSSNEMFMDDCEGYSEFLSTPTLALKSIYSPPPTSSSLLGGSFAIILDD